MVQEVQQQGNWYQTPNEIQGIGEIRRRVREHTQVTEPFGYRITVTTSITASADSQEHSGYKKGTLTLSSEYGTTEFKIINNGIRIPLAGAYLIEMKNKGGSSPNGIWTNALKVDGNTIISQQTSDNIDYTTLTRVVNFGRYDMVEARGDLYRGGSGGYSSTASWTITIQKI